MKIILKDVNNEYSNITFVKGIDPFTQILKEFNPREEPFEAQIFAINEIIDSHELAKFKISIQNRNINIKHFFSNIRETVLAARSLKIDSTYASEKEIKNKLLLFTSKEKKNLLHQGTVRSGDRISSNGDLVIIGDVNPGAIVTAKNNVYVWGKLLGIAFAGQGGNQNAFIASLHLNPLQLRINENVAIGPTDKPKNYYPEIALLKNQSIIIEPYLIDSSQ